MRVHQIGRRDPNETCEHMSSAWTWTDPRNMLSSGNFPPPYCDAISCGIGLDVAPVVLEGGLPAQPPIVTCSSWSN